MFDRPASTFNLMPGLKGYWLEGKTLNDVLIQMLQ